MINKILGKKTYLWTHGFYGNESIFKATIKKLFFNLSKGVFLYGDYAKNIMVKRGFNPDKLHVIYNSLDYDHQINLRKSLTKNDIFKNNFKNDFRNIVFIGRLTKVKKLSQLLLAQNELRSQSSNFNLIFIGDGIEKLI